MKFLKALPIIGSLVSLYFIITSAMAYRPGSASFGHASLMIVAFGILLFVCYMVNKELKKCPGSRKTKGTKVNNHNKYTPSPLYYASSFYIGQPVVTTEEYGEGPGFHCYIDNIDRTCIGRPFRIGMVGNDTYDWVSFDEIIPDVDFENIDMEVAL